MVSVSLSPALQLLLAYKMVKEITVGKQDGKVRNQPYPARRITSGAMYSGVPNTVLSRNCLLSLSKQPSYRLVATGDRQQLTHPSPTPQLLLVSVIGHNKTPCTDNSVPGTT